MNHPRIIITALKGGSGKTLFSVGLIAALKRRGKSVAPYKKGPDYIDAGWLALAAGRPCYNLDNFLIPEEKVGHSFISRTGPEDIAVIEGNRGIFDGLDTEGSTSTASLARLIHAPAILCMDCTKATRTIAALINGCVAFESDTPVKAVILNNIAGPRHERILRDTVKKYCTVPVVGAVWKLKQKLFPERHMGLVPTAEHDWARDSVNAAAELAESRLDIDAIVRIAEQAGPLTATTGRRETGPKKPPARTGDATIGVLRDSAFQFYYPENLEALEAEGATLRFLSPMNEKDVSGLDEIDGLYIGGGFPETHAERLSENAPFRKRVKDLAEGGMPMYGECGGLLYMGKELEIEGTTHPMTGIFPIRYGFSPKPQGHGYTMVEVVAENPWFEVGTEIRGHEFHYSFAESWDGEADALAFVMKRGTGLLNKRDGICRKNVIGTYTHIHASGTPVWAKSLVRLAREYANGRSLLRKSAF